MGYKLLLLPAFSGSNPYRKLSFLYFPKNPRCANCKYQLSVTIFWKIITKLNVPEPEIAHVIKPECSICSIVSISTQTWPNAIPVIETPWIIPMIPGCCITLGTEIDIVECIQPEIFSSRSPLRNSTMSNPFHAAKCSVKICSGTIARSMCIGHHIVSINAAITIYILAQKIAGLRALWSGIIYILPGLCNPRSR